MKRAIKPNPKTTRSGWEELRSAHALFEHAGESFMDRYSAEELLAIARAYHACAHEMPPWVWSERQLKNALRGLVPTFVVNQGGWLVPSYAKRSA